MKKLAVLPTLALIALAMVGCGGDDSSSSTSSAGSGGNSVDAMFIAGMIPHHESAVEMAELGVKNAEHPEIKKLSEAIIEGQTSEISSMKSMRASMPDADSSMMSEHDMMEMDGQVASLKNADDFDLAFIDAMIPHHESAVVMANKQLSSGSNADLKQLSREIVKAQTKEIAQMQEWRKDWYGSALATESDSESMHMDH